MRLRRPLAALGLACAALAAGCGGDAAGKNAYVEEVQAAQRAYVDGFERALRRLTATSTVAQDRATMGRYVGLTDRFAESLREADVPEGVRSEHKRLVAAVTSIRTQFRRAQRRLAEGRAGDRAAVRSELAGEVGAAQRRITAAVSAINEALQR